MKLAFPHEFNCNVTYDVYQWLDDMNLEEYVDWQLRTEPTAVKGIAFKSGSIALMFMLAFHQT
jgi:hypothetical protein